MQRSTNLANVEAGVAYGILAASAKTNIAIHYVFELQFQSRNINCGMPPAPRTGIDQLLKVVQSVQTNSITQTNKEHVMHDIATVKVTQRDQQVLNFLVKGCSNKEIARELSMSPRTVKQHLRTLFLRAGITSGRKRVVLAMAILQKEQP